METIPELIVLYREPLLLSLLIQISNVCGSDYGYDYDIRKKARPAQGLAGLHFL